MSLGVIMPKLSNKTPSPWKPFQLLIRGVQEIPSSPQAIYAVDVALGCLPDVEGKTVQDTTHFGQRTLRNQAGSDLETSSQKNSSPCTKRSNESCQHRKTISSSMKSINHSKTPNGKIASLICWGSQQRSY